MQNKNTATDNPIAAFSEDVTDRVTEAKDSVVDMARSASKKIGEGRTIAADGLDSAASAVHERANDLPGERVQNATESVHRRVRPWI